MSEPLLATDPQTSATVSASAGTGKTWLLVTRLIRLLLTGTRPDGILAVTFTRKAAAEMQNRLNERLLEMAQCSDQELLGILIKIDVPTDETTLHKARTLYESLLSSPHSIHTSTFHSFCQDILRRFPIEAGIAPGFELLESTADIKQEAWNAFCAQASSHPDGDSAHSLETLIDACNGLSNTISAIDSFLEHRGDWWALTEGQDDPLAFAVENLSTQLNITHVESPLQDLFTESLLEDLSEFVSLLQKHPGKQNNEALDALSVARDTSIGYQDRFQKIIKVFFTTAGEPRKRSANKTQAKKMGEAGQDRFLEIHHNLCKSINDTKERINTLEAFQRISSWYRAGIEVLNYFQHLKNELRVLDFTDLEWRTYLLINHSNNVHWIQYKLDQRIDHLLVDEFQDTNPTQWQLLLPLLQELAASENERQRSVFLVGDNKQSIYRFRRADPELFDAAQLWLKDQLNAKSQPLDISWRSAEAIMAFVNRVFGDGPLNTRLTHFSKHTTHYPDLWGRVEFLPLVEPDEDQDISDNKLNTPVQLRDPLDTPFLLDEDQRHQEEGKLIAERINKLFHSQTLIGHASNARPIRYSDIIILVRNRTHVSRYEQALREANIPYTSATRGTLLNSLEIRDIVNLLEWLIAPFNNLALANVLRSPIFDCSNDDLINLAMQKEGNWQERLHFLASNSETGTQTATDKLQRAHTLLSRWHNLVGKLPVHDLLDHIYCEGDVINRYRAGYPSHLHHSVSANLTRFIELALEIDSGRHPTVGRFVSRLQSLRQMEKEAPDEGLSIESESRVRILTIHASKGLEAPVVFLADCAFKTTKNKAYQTLVNWPASQKKPDCFLLVGKKDSRDPFTRNIIDQHINAESREDANLLYVAITRARQLLFISGCRPTTGTDLGWYGLMSDQCTDKTSHRPSVIESGQYPSSSRKKNVTQASLPAVDVQLRHPLKIEEKDLIIAPSYQTGTLNQLSRDNQESKYLREDARTRGIVIHRCLQLLCENNLQTVNVSVIANQLGGELGIEQNDPDLGSYINEAVDVFRQPDFAHIFNNTQYESAYNEVPIQFLSNEQMVYGIIDRVVITETKILVIDYKTHRLSETVQISELTEYYRPQLEHYCQGASKLWPGKKIQGALLLTHHKKLVDMVFNY